MIEFEESPESSNRELERGGAELKDVELSKNKYIRLGTRGKVKIPYYKGIYSRR